MGDPSATTVDPRELAVPRDVAAGLWAALYARDWSRLRSFFGPDSIYYDVPTTAAAAARGPEHIEARLRTALAGLSEYSHGTSRVVAEGNLVITEHEEHWGWPTGEKVTLPFVSVQRIEDGVIMLWRDYWDLNTLLAAAPPGWQKAMAAGDLSWVFDATGLV
ncbi:nuclear transport factor 2 family protein [Frankia sp. AgB1.9]|uniref:nuclear transport factor 2 family protein n=1 Tax=unclassified Frankia TaxID=2632575 RepID=UPI001931E684|nr:MULTISPECIES: nuclear transport factor 2 family protein [unclassified Frankia]MBL7490489.1 nuclear transport factor 2 family protein [Frankia sp. AgW1.1]MBL7552085.1 nuclear transport factor 2 family protein [Frankia sp. AgB1.9]MBL7620586.1 nuclear transport factor 2 family protein [Frankia sp. AgB1.8]